MLGIVLYRIVNDGSAAGSSYIDPMISGILNNVAVNGSASPALNLDSGTPSGDGKSFYGTEASGANLSEIRSGKPYSGGGPSLSGHIGHGSTLLR
jgi:hypothetical protein